MTSLEKTNSEIQEIDLKLEQTKAGEKRNRMRAILNEHSMIMCDVIFFCCSLGRYWEGAVWFRRTRRVHGEHQERLQPTTLLALLKIGTCLCNGLLKRMYDVALHRIQRWRWALIYQLEGGIGEAILTLDACPIITPATVSSLVIIWRGVISTEARLPTI